MYLVALNILLVNKSLIFNERRHAQVICSDNSEFGSGHYFLDCSRYERRMKDFGITNYCIPSKLLFLAHLSRGIQCGARLSVHIFKDLLL